MGTHHIFESDFDCLTDCQTEKIMLRYSVTRMSCRSASAAPKLKYLIDNKWVESTTDTYMPVHNPATQDVVAQVPQMTQAEMDAVAESSAKAYQSWKNTSILTRQQIMLKYQELIKKHKTEIATLITIENGKTLPDAEGDVHRGLQVVEMACGIPSIIQGETLQSVSSDLDIKSFREPLGVCAGIAPFNFPAMIPLWMYPVALMCGNTYILKPSERVPGAGHRLVELMLEAGLPAGCLNIVHGSHDTVNFICDNKHIRAVSFVGGNGAGEHINRRGAGENGKRVQSNMGAKNHGVIMPDANKEYTINQLVGAAFGAAGQRCMALSTAVMVGDAKDWMEEVAEKATKLRISAGHEPHADLGPVISPEAKERICSLIQTAVDEGAELMIDGRNVTVEEYPDGNFVGPTIITNMKKEMTAYINEIFGPVLCVVNVDTLE